LFLINIETGRFGVLVEPKQSKKNRNKSKKGKNIIKNIIHLPQKAKNFNKNLNEG
jgi:hypothetical protein